VLYPGAAKLKVPEVVIVPPCKPLPVATDVTVPEPPDVAMLMPPAELVIAIPEPAVNVVNVKPVPLPIATCPFVGVEVKPVPP
jgi:hypothetical protein